MHHPAVLIAIARHRNPGHPTCIRGTMEHVASIATPAAQSVGFEYIQVDVADVDDAELLRIFEHSLINPVWAFFHNLHFAHYTKRNLLLEYIFNAPENGSYFCVVVDPGHRNHDLMHPALAAKMYHLSIDQNGIMTEPEYCYTQDAAQAFV